MAAPPQTASPHTTPPPTVPPLIVPVLTDCHTHVYLPGYVRLLRARARVPRMVGPEGAERLVILPGEDDEATTGRGRPVGGEYWDSRRKLAYMDAHGIGRSVLSLANPWLEFLDPAESASVAAALNDELEGWCQDSGGRFHGLGVLPHGDAASAAAEMARIATLPHLHGAILGTSGLGAGLDDPALAPLWRVAEAEGLVVFVHPHQGLGNDRFGGAGHALILALGFPFDTTAAVARLVLAGVIERHPDLRLLVAHAGGTLPYLAGRLDACVATDLAHRFPLRHPPSWSLGRLWLDAVAGSPATLDCAAALVGTERLVFGTDHPFFRPDVAEDRLDRSPWPMATEHRAMLGTLDPATAAAIGAGNAERLFRLPPAG